MMNDLFGTRTVLATNLRRDKLLLPVWVVTFAAVTGGSAAATAGLYPDEASRSLAAQLINATPALVAMYGRVYDPTSLGAIGLIKPTGWGTVMVALFALLVVIRHTRADEELGRYELLAGGSIGRFASLAAALVTATIGVVGIGATTAVALLASGLPAAGSLAFGLTWIAAGLLFAGVGAVAAQVTASARAARGLAVGALAVAYLLRAAGDTIGRTEPAWPTGCLPSAGLSRSARSPEIASCWPCCRWPAGWFWWRWRVCWFGTAISGPGCSRSAAGQQKPGQSSPGPTGWRGDCSGRRSSAGSSRSSC